MKLCLACSKLAGHDVYKDEQDFYRRGGKLQPSCKDHEKALWKKRYKPRSGDQSFRITISDLEWMAYYKKW